LGTILSKIIGQDHFVRIAACGAGFDAFLSVPYFFDVSFFGLPVVSVVLCYDFGHRLQLSIIKKKIFL
jgi:hypothetical protein